MKGSLHCCSSVRIIHNLPKPQCQRRFLLLLTSRTSAVTGDRGRAPQRRAGRPFVAVMFHTDQVMPEPQCTVTPPARGGKHRVRRPCLCHTIQAADGGTLSVNHRWQGRRSLAMFLRPTEGTGAATRPRALLLNIYTLVKRVKLTRRLPKICEALKKTQLIFSSIY